MTLDQHSQKGDIEKFTKIFGRAAQLRVVAPGRVNLIGEHVDYHEGYVLPAAIDRFVRVVGAARDDLTVNIHSATFHGAHSFSLDREMGEVAGWARRAEGIIRTVIDDSPERRGLDLWMDSDLPVGGGLSSSAASMAALGNVAAEINGKKLETVPFAKTLQDAEHRFAEVQCGIMDQLAVLNSKKDTALFVDCRTLEMQHVPLPPQWSLVVVDTGVRHDLATSEYNRRRRECNAVLRLLQAANPGIRSLRDATMEELEAVRERAGETGYRRCRHVIYENERVPAAIEALKADRGEIVGKLFRASHDSLRHDYEVSCRELDALVDTAQEIDGCIASRMTGGGFGGCTVNLVESGAVESFVEAIARKYTERTKLEAKAIVARPSDGLKIERL